MLITRRLEFDAGHRIPHHKSQCRHLHGHRYGIEVTVSGAAIDRAGESDNGMVMDFSDVKELVRTHIVERWDHAFLCWREDTQVATFLASLPGHKTVMLDRVLPPRIWPRLHTISWSRYLQTATATACACMQYGSMKHPIAGPMSTEVELTAQRG